MTDVSVLIPAREEIYLQNTIDSVLANSRADTEIIVVLDGYWPFVSIPDNPRVVILHHTVARGQRQSINEAARIAKGKYLMKLDAHCAVGPGFDRILIDDYQPGWTVVPRMYNLDIETWTPKLHKRTDYMYVGMHPGHELRAEYYEYKDYKGSQYRRLRQPDNDRLIDETMCCMGPGWFLSAEQFWKQGGCDEAHGSWGAQSVEVSLKAWLSGNALMVNKRTWFAHWFREHECPWPMSGRDQEKARAYSRDLWLNDKWPGAVRKLDWLVKKFNPPGWEDWVEPDKTKEINTILYNHLHKKHHDTYYRGIVAVKMPSDMLLYHRVIWETKPTLIIEVGTRFGGSALFLQDQLDLLGGGRVRADNDEDFGRCVYTIDIKDQVANKDPRITYLVGNSLDKKIRELILERFESERIMVILDGDHRRVHVKWELQYYSPLVTPGCYLVVEDCYGSSGDLYGPGEARDWFLSTKQGHQFVQTNLDREYLVGFVRGGWLRRK